MEGDEAGLGETPTLTSARRRNVGMAGETQILPMFEEDTDDDEGEAPERWNAPDPSSDVRSYEDVWRHVGTFLRGSGIGPFIFIFLVRLCIEHLTSMIFVVVSSVGVYRIDREIKRQLSLRRGRNLTTLAKMAVLCLATYALMCSSQDFAPMGDKRLWAVISEPSEPHRHSLRGEVIFVEGAPAAAPAAPRVGHLAPKDVGTLFWAVYYPDVGLRLLCLALEAIIIIAWTGYAEGATGSMRRFYAMARGARRCCGAQGRDGAAPDVEEGGGSMFASDTEAPRSQFFMLVRLRGPRAAGKRDTRRGGGLSQRSPPIRPSYRNRGRRVSVGPPRGSPAGRRARCQAPPHRTLTRRPPISSPVALVPRPRPPHSGTRSTRRRPSS